jgi:hypothetical protein
VVAWDLYNEPGNSGRKEKSLPLLAASFDWARAAQPAQPITVGVWHAELTALNQLCLDRSDVISFHAYRDRAAAEAAIRELLPLGRPLLCTEWMSRVHGSFFATHLPLWQEHRVGWYMWGLVNGRTQTHMPWGSVPGAGEPPLWQHDILYSDGRPYRPEEIDLLRQAAGAG